MSRSWSARVLDTPDDKDKRQASYVRWRQAQYTCIVCERAGVHLESYPDVMRAAWRLRETHRVCVFCLLPPSKYAATPDWIRPVQNVTRAKPRETGESSTSGQIIDDDEDLFGDNDDGAAM